MCVCILLSLHDAQDTVFLLIIAKSYDFFSFLHSTIQGLSPNCRLFSRGILKGYGWDSCVVSQGSHTPPACCRSLSRWPGVQTLTSHPTTTGPSWGAEAENLSGYPPGRIRGTLLQRNHAGDFTVAEMEKERVVVWNEACFGCSVEQIHVGRPWAWV